MSVATVSIAFALTALGWTPMEPVEGARPGDPLALHAIEGEILNAAFPLLFDSGAHVKPDVVLVQKPRHGEFIPWKWPEFHYQPHGGYFGHDSFVVDIRESADHPAVRLNYEIDVLPRKMPLFGRWTPGQRRGAGLYDTLNRTFLLCSSEAGSIDGGYYVLDCTSHQVERVPQGAIAVAVAGESGEADRLALFVPGTGTLYWLSAQGSGFGVDQTEEYPRAVGTFPVFGYWRDAATGALAFVSRKGAVAVLGPGGSWDPWPFNIETWPGDELMLPVRWPAGDADALTLVGPAGDFAWWKADGEAGWVDSPTAAPWDHRRRFYWQPEEGGVQRNILVHSLVQTLDALVTEVVVIFGTLPDGADPQTMPLKFPNDPPSGP